MDKGGERNGHIGETIRHFACKKGRPWRNDPDLPISKIPILGIN